MLNRIGNPGLLTALNFDTFSQRTITCDTEFSSNVTLQDYTGRHPDIVTDGQGRATFHESHPTPAPQSPSYLCFSRAGVDTPFEPAGGGQIRPSRRRQSQHVRGARRRPGCRAILVRVGFTNPCHPQGRRRPRQAGESQTLEILSPDLLGGRLGARRTRALCSSERPLPPMVSRLSALPGSIRRPMAFPSRWR